MKFYSTLLTALFSMFACQADYSSKYEELQALLPKNTQNMLKNDSNAFGDPRIMEVIKNLDSNAKQLSDGVSSQEIVKNAMACNLKILSALVKEKELALPKPEGNNYITTGIISAMVTAVFTDIAHQKFDCWDTSNAFQRNLIKAGFFLPAVALTIYGIIKLNKWNKKHQVVLSLHSDLLQAYTLFCEFFTNKPLTGDPVNRRTWHTRKHKYFLRTEEHSYSRVERAPQATKEIEHAEIKESAPERHDTLEEKDTRPEWVKSLPPEIS